VGIDIDLVNVEHAELIRREVEALAGRTPLRRRGSKGMMLVYQKSDDPIAKIKIIERVEPGESTPQELSSSSLAKVDNSSASGSIPPVCLTRG
jgi:hypothetical protein